MSTTSTVEIRKENERYTAVDRMTGATGVGKTRTLALVALVGSLASHPDDEDSHQVSVEFKEKVERSREQYERGEHSSLEAVRERLND